MLPLFLLVLMCCFLAESNSSRSSSSVAFLSSSNQLNRNQNQTTHKNRLPSSRIINGSPAEIGEFPFMVLVKNRDYDILCGGALFNPGKVLTACHCTIVNDTNIRGSNYTVLPHNSLTMDAGTVYRKAQDKNRQRQHSREIAVHPKCAFSKAFYWEYDMSVVTTRNPFRINQFVSPGPPIAEDANMVDQMIKEKVKCTHAGWGLMNQGKNFVLPQALMKTTLSLIAHDVCSKIYRDAIRRKNFTYTVSKNIQLCAMESGTETAVGDSGGPLICKNFIVGINSMGYNVATLGSPTVFARVDVASGWISPKEVKSKVWLDSGARSVLRSDTVFLISMWALF